MPAIEIERLIQQIRRHPEYGSTAALAESYASLGLRVFSDPFSRELTDLVRQAVRSQTPLSVIRISDGEANFLSFGVYPDTPNLDRETARKTLQKHCGAVAHDELWALALREMMMSAVLQADIIGVVGLWRPSPLIDVEELAQSLKEDVRGISGQWRAMDYMLRLARAGLLLNKIIASTHLYFGILSHLHALLADVERILLITDRIAVVDALRRRYPDREIRHIAAVRRGSAPDRRRHGPKFLVETAALLAGDLRGWCCLVGAGPWAEIYCTWIKARGGVAVDIGSGFDLLDGTTSRPIHRRLGLDAVNPYALSSIGEAIT